MPTKEEIVEKMTGELDKEKRKQADAAQE